MSEDIWLGICGTFPLVNPASVCVDSQMPSISLPGEEGVCCFFRNHTYGEKNKMEQRKHYRLKTGMYFALLVAVNELCKDETCFEIIRKISRKEAKRLNIDVSSWTDVSQDMLTRQMFCSGAALFKKKDDWYMCRTDILFSLLSSFFILFRESDKNVFQLLEDNARQYGHTPVYPASSQSEFMTALNKERQKLYARLPKEGRI